eukprot:TRINITY_DN10908_c0_g1_i1.p1 TRINITY_DN10908_c0_g1~~TRINITY_DN10908_c0_g1_i1.p1  ORF type:complete len:338 (+),score=48.35 TRINITY_DN10908_c0_g1_i1:69-1082(+)
MRMAKKPVLHILINAILREDDPLVRSRDEAFAHNDGKAEFCVEMQQLGNDLGYNTTIDHMRLDNYQKVIDSIPQHATVLCLCDGSEDDGFPGISVLKYLEKSALKWLGCSSYFDHTSSSKTLMKSLFVSSGVRTPNHVLLDRGCVDVVAAIQPLRLPLFVKLNDSYSSMGIEEDSYCPSTEKAVQKIFSLLAKFPKVLIEEFVDGREFTILCLGDATRGVTVFPPVERKFPDSVAAEQRFVTFERTWHDWKSMSFVVCPHGALLDELSAQARCAYLAVGGCGFGRVDARIDETTGRVYVLEVNALPGIGENSSTNECLRACGKSMVDFMRLFLLPQP